MASTRYLALLRGINVGGNNLIKMTELRASFEELRFTDVETYIQSGNVVFSSSAAKKPKLVAIIEQALSARFGYASKVVLISAAELERVVSEAPAGFGKLPARYRYDVLFVKEPMTPDQVLERFTPKSGVDTVATGAHAVYFRRLDARATQSNLPKLVQLPAYKSITARNWNTTTKLLALLSRGC